MGKITGKFKLKINICTENSNGNSINVKKYGKMKVKTHKHQKVREIHTEIQIMSKSAGNQNWNPTNIKSAGKFKFPEFHALFVLQQEICKMRLFWVIFEHCGLESRESKTLYGSKLQQLFSLK